MRSNNDLPGSPTPDRASGVEGVDLLKMVAALLDARRTIIAWTLIAGMATAALVLLMPKKYTTTLSFTPVGMMSATGALAGLAGQFGVTLPGTDPSASPDFYVSLVSTREMGEPIVTSRYVVQEDEGSREATFVELYDIDESTPGKTIAEAITFLNEEVLSVGTDPRTSIVTIRARTEWPELSFEICRRLLLQIEEFNHESRRTQAFAERTFLAERVDTAQAELRRAENALQSFLAKNRSFQNDPSLVFEHDRFQRDVGMRNSVYTMLMQSYEQARVAAVRNTPSLSIIEEAKLPLRYDPRRVALKAVLGAFFGCLLAVAWVVLRGATRELRNDDPARLTRVEEVWRDTVGDLQVLVGRRRGAPRR